MRSYKRVRSRHYENLIYSRLGSCGPIPALIYSSLVNGSIVPINCSDNEMLQKRNLKENKVFELCVQKIWKF